MFVIKQEAIKQVIKNSLAFCEKQNAFSLFDTVLIIKNDNMIVILEGNNGSSASLTNIDNPDNKYMIIKTNIGILIKIINNIKSKEIIITPQEQGLLFISEHEDKKNESSTKKNSSNYNFNIYSHNIYLNELNEEERNDLLQPYEVYCQNLLNNSEISASLINNLDAEINIQDVNSFLQFLKKINYAASTENDRDFNNIFFQWQDNKITANSSNRIKIAIARINTENINNQNPIKFSCDKKAINNIIKGAQNFPEEHLIIKVLANSRIYFFLGKKMIMEIGYHKNRGINMEKFFDALEDSCIFTCHTHELKQALDGAKSFATKFHYSILMNTIEQNPNENSFNNDDQKIDEHNITNKIRFFFQEPNQGNVESYLSYNFIKYDDINVELNVLYLCEIVSILQEKYCAVMINKKNNYLFILPLKELEMDKEYFTNNNIQKIYTDIHLLMCIR